MPGTTFIVLLHPMLAAADSHHSLHGKVRALGKKLGCEVDPSQKYLDQQERCRLLSQDTTLHDERREELRMMATVFGGAHVTAKELDAMQGSDRKD